MTTTQIITAARQARARAAEISAATSRQIGVDNIGGFRIFEIINGDVVDIATNVPAHNLIAKLNEIA